MSALLSLAAAISGMLQPGPPEPQDQVATGMMALQADVQACQLLSIQDLHAWQPARHKPRNSVQVSGLEILLGP